MKFLYVWYENGMEVRSFDFRHSSRAMGEMIVIPIVEGEFRLNPTCVKAGSLFEMEERIIQKVKYGKTWNTQQIQEWLVSIGYSKSQAGNRIKRVPAPEYNQLTGEPIWK